MPAQLTTRKRHRAYSALAPCRRRFLRCGSAARGASGSETPRPSTRATRCTRSPRTSITRGSSASSPALIGAGTRPDRRSRARRDGGRWRRSFPGRWYSRAAHAGAAVAACARCGHSSSRLVPEIAIGLFAHDARPAARPLVDRGARRSPRWACLRAAPGGQDGVGALRGGRAAGGRRGGSKVTGVAPASGAGRRVRIPSGASITRARSRPGPASPPGPSSVVPFVAFEARPAGRCSRTAWSTRSTRPGFSLRNVGGARRRPARVPLAARRCPRGPRGARGLASADSDAVGASALRRRLRSRSPCSCRSASGAASPSRTGSRPPCSPLAPRPPVQARRAARRLVVAATLLSRRHRRCRSRLGAHPRRRPARASHLRRPARPRQRALRVADGRRRRPRRNASRCA